MATPESGNSDRRATKTTLGKESCHRSASITTS